MEATKGRKMYSPLFLKFLLSYGAKTEIETTSEQNKQEEPSINSIAYNYTKFATIPIKNN